MVIPIALVTLQIVCLAPPGFGAVALSVTAYRQTSNSLEFLYSPPYITSVTSLSALLADASTSLTINGFNFGDTEVINGVLIAPNVTVTVGNATCNSLFRPTSTVMSCQSPPGIDMGPTNVTVEVLKAGVTQTSNDFVVMLVCSPGAFGVP